MTIQNTNYIVTIMSVVDQSISALSPNNSITVQAPMPSDFLYDAATQYDAPFTQGVTGNPALDTLMRVAFSSKLITQSMTAQLWQGSTETDLSLELEFHAESDPIAEVRNPIVQLLKLATPSLQNGGLLTSPGPKIDQKILDDIVSKAKPIVGQALQAITGTNPLGGNSTQTTMTNPYNGVANGAQNAQPNSNPADSKSFGTADYFKRSVKDQISIKIGNFALFDSVVISSVQKTYESQFDPVTGLPWYAKVGIRFKPLFMVVQEDLDKIFSAPQSSGIPTNQLPISVGSLRPNLTSSLSLNPGNVINNGLSQLGGLAKSAGNAITSLFQ